MIFKQMYFYSDWYFCYLGLLEMKPPHILTMSFSGIWQIFLEF